MVKSQKMVITSEEKEIQSVACMWLIKFDFSYSKLIAQKGAFADFIVEHLREMEEDEEGKIDSSAFPFSMSQIKFPNFTTELHEIKEALTPSVNGSIIFERAISVRSSQTKMNR